MSDDTELRVTKLPLRIMTRVDERMYPDRIFACMSSAARAGLTPCVRYSNSEDGISITDFVEAVPFPVPQALVQLTGTLRRLHALPLFPKAFNYVTAHNGFIWRFRKANTGTHHIAAPSPQETDDARLRVSESFQRAS